MPAIPFPHFPESAEWSRLPLPLLPHPSRIHVPRSGGIPTYHGMNFTQFFGAFNDNLFKQLVLLICVNYAASGRRLPDSTRRPCSRCRLCSSLGSPGYLADRISKQKIVVAMKIAEIAVMLAGFLAFYSTLGPTGWLMCVVFLMGTHSAFFGPSKYGILPELFRERDLPQVNGMIQMTTFLAIICGAALAGFIKEWFAQQTVAGKCHVRWDCHHRHTDVVIGAPHADRPARPPVYAGVPVHQCRDVADVPLGPAPVSTCC